MFLDTNKRKKKNLFPGKYLEEALNVQILRSSKGVSYIVNKQYNWSYLLVEQ